MPPKRSSDLAVTPQVTRLGLFHAARLGVMGCGALVDRRLSRAAGGGRWVVASVVVVVGVLLSLVAPASGVAADPVGVIREFSVHNPFAIAAGPDGNLWFTRNPGDTIGRITPTGTITVFSPPTAGGLPFGIAPGADGNLWFTEFFHNKIGRITPTGTVTGEFLIPTANSVPEFIAAGADGNLWFTEGPPPAIGVNPRIGRITLTGTITEFPIPDEFGAPFAIAAGPDGNMWFTMRDSKIGRITPTGTITEFPIRHAANPEGIAPGPDGNLWFTEESANKIGRITPTGTITEFPIPTANSHPIGIAPGPDGNLWFAEAIGGQIGRITPTGTITEFPLPPSLQTRILALIAPGPDGNLWFTEQIGKGIGSIGAGVSDASVRAPSVIGSRQQGTRQVCQGDAWAQWAGQTPSHDAFPFDGYQWRLDGSPIAGATGQAYTPTTADIGHVLSCKVTVTYPLLNVTVSAISAGVTVIPSARMLAAQLVTDADHLPPGRALHKKASAIQTAVNAGQTTTACAGITGLLRFVKAQTGKHLSKTNASTLTTDANNLAAALGC